MRNGVNGDLICRSALLEPYETLVSGLKDSNNGTVAGFVKAITKHIKLAPTVDAVSRLVVEHIKWERDTAIQQLKDHGIPFGGTAPDVVEVVRCKDCKWWRNETCTNVNGAGGCISNEEWFCRSGERKEA